MSQFKPGVLSAPPLPPLPVWLCCCGNLRCYDFMFVYVNGLNCTWRCGWLWATELQLLPGCDSVMHCGWLWATELQLLPGCDSVMHCG